MIAFTQIFIKIGKKNNQTFHQILKVIFNDLQFASLLCQHSYQILIRSDFKQ